MVSAPYAALDYEDGTPRAAAIRQAHALRATKGVGTWVHRDLSPYNGMTQLVLVAIGLEPASAEKWGFLALA
jgi:hypothetical protein